MKFNDMPYKHIDIKDYQIKQNALIEEIKKTTIHSNLKKLMDSYDKNYIDVTTNMALAEVRHTIDTFDEYYTKEYNYICEISPLIDNITDNFNSVILNHSEINFIKETYGQYYILKLQIKAKTFNEEIIDLLILESKLENDYDILIAGAKIPFDGKINNLSQMALYSHNLDRNIRRNAALAVDNFYRENDETIGNIYTELVNVRDKIAKKLGFNNFIELGYLRLNRVDYDAKMVSEFRNNLKKYVVPLASKIYDKQSSRLGIKKPYWYDFSLNYIDGDPIPKGNKDELVNKALKMYQEMSNETSEFFKFMLDNELMNLDTKPGKMGGGYCTHFTKYDSPFIFANFNGTKDDINVLTHEAGHAFESYYANKFIANKDLICPTYEAAEIHSTTMEFFAYPFLSSFFGDDTLKYIHSHMSEAITFLPYSLAVDHFQHLVYENPNKDQVWRKKIWLELEQIYLPWRDYGECSFTASGTFWYRQSHIFGSPFYYIDYALAQICALEFYLEDLKDHSNAWNRYLKLCSLGGTMPFLQLIKEIGLSSPFDMNTIKNIIDSLVPIIERIKI